MSSTIDYEHFSKLSMMVGTIQSAEDIPKADKLYKIMVDLGPTIGTRQIVAGIKPSYEKESLIGHHQANLLVGPDDEHGSHGGAVRGRAAVGQVGVRGKHVVELGHRERGVVDDREVGGGAREGLDVTLPLLVVLNAVDGYAHHLRIALLELG